MQNLQKGHCLIETDSDVERSSTPNQSVLDLNTTHKGLEVANNRLRHIPLQGQSNFRDLGGYQTEDNKTVKWGCLFRSGQLSNLTALDLDYLSSLPLTTIVDFRSEEESEEQKTLLPKTVTNEILLPITPGNLSKNQVMQIVQEGDIGLATKFLVDINEQLVLHNQSQYKAFFKEVECSEAPLMFNCTAGKDRTGLAAALLLSALGVNQHTVIEDYLLTNQYVNLDIQRIQKQFNLETQQAETLLTLFTVQEQFLDKALNTIEEYYTSVEQYLTEILEVDIALLKAKYLY